MKLSVKRDAADMAVISGATALYNLLLLCWRFAVSLWYTAKFAAKHHLKVHASSCTYYFLVSLVPAVIVSGWGVAALADKFGFMAKLRLLNKIQLYTQIQNIISSFDIAASSLKTAGVFGIIIMLWCASSLMKAIRNAFMVIFPAKKISKGIITMITAHIMVPLLIIIAILISSLSSVIIRSLRKLLVNELHLIEKSTLFSIMTPLLTAFLIAVTAYACFMLLSPNRPKNKPAVTGSLLFALYFLSLQYGLSVLMIRLIESYAKYGAISGILLLLLWAYMMFYGLFLTAEYVHVINNFGNINYSHYIYAQIKEKPSFLEKFLMLKLPFGDKTYLTHIAKDEKKHYNSTEFAFCKVIRGEVIVVANGNGQAQTLSDGETYKLIGAQFSSAELSGLSDSYVLVVPENELSNLINSYPQAWLKISSG
jgi:YihY family inner membrane protein